MADTGSNSLNDARCIMLYMNDTVYVCDHEVGYVEKFAITGTSRTAATSHTSDHLHYISIDKAGGLYTTNDDTNTVRYYPAGSMVPTVLVGSSSSINGLDEPTATAVDDNYTLYINDQNNKRKEYSVTMLFYSSFFAATDK